MKRALVLLLTCATAVVWLPARRGWAEELQVGKKPPPLGLERILNAPASTKANWLALKGKIVVLEFWATWCKPCVDALPHLNELADEFEGKPVQFISITDEEETIVEPFLKTKPINGWIGLDTDKSMANEWITSLPGTVIVDQQGMIAAVTDPTSLTARHLHDLLAGKKVSFPRLFVAARSVERPQESARPEREAMFQVTVRPSEGAGRLTNYRSDIRDLGSSVLEVLSRCHKVDPVRIIFPKGSLPDGKFDFVVRTPAKDPEVARSWLRQAVETTFGLIGRRKTIDMNVYVLTGKTPRAKHLTVTAYTGGGSLGGDRGNLKALNIPFALLRQKLESILEQPVVDETELNGQYDLQLKWDQQDDKRLNAQALIKSVREQLGLELTPAKRSIEVLVLERTNAGGSP